MNDLASPSLFLDSASIVAVILSKDRAASPGYGLFKMGEANLIHLDTSEDVLREAQGVLQAVLGDDADRVKVLLAENLAMGNVAIAPPPNDQTVRQCLAITNYAPDAKVLAAAVERDCEVFVTYDKQHLLHNPKIGPPNTRIVVMTGGEAKAWAIDQIGVRSRLRAEQKRKNK
jgi:predicted nucleic acid-binding protein